MNVRIYVVEDEAENEGEFSLVQMLVGICVVREKMKK